MIKMTTNIKFRKTSHAHVVIIITIKVIII